MRMLHKSVAGKDGASRHLGRGRSRWRSVLIGLERVLLVTGFVLVTFYAAARLESGLAARTALDEIEASQTPAMPAATTTDTENPASAGGNSSSPQMELPNVEFRWWGERRVKAYKRAVEKQSGVPLAVLRIPKIHLEAPLFDGTDELTLNHAVGRIAGTARPGEPGNLGIAGHRDGFFRGLKDVAVGDAIELMTLQETRRYIVEQIQIVAPHEVEVLRPTSLPSLTLVTCYPFYFFGSAPQRYIVTAFLSPEKNGESEIPLLTRRDQQRIQLGEKR
jgi:sortase A